ncbi:MAG: ACT domain-containing protein, partial [Chthoniobacterales bacterium]
PEIRNVTHFFVLGHKPVVRLGKKSAKTAFVAALKNSCGSLHAFLGPFAKHKVNLKRIVSRPVPGHPETYVFFIEIEGAQEEAKVSRALRAAREFADIQQFFGSYPVGKKYPS